MKRKTLSKNETMIRAIAECNTALERAWRHWAVNNDDLRAILGAVFELRIHGGKGLRLQEPHE